MQRGFTLTRLRAQYLWKSDADSGNLFRGAMGVIKVQAGTLLATYPDPATDPDADWLWHSSLIMFQDNPTTTGRAKVWDIVDNRSQRRMADHQQIAVVYSSLTAVNTVMAFAGRALFLLP